MDRTERAKLWRDIHGMKSQGMGNRKIAETLNSIGCTTRRGNTWTEQAVSLFHIRNKPKRAVAQEVVPNKPRTIRVKRGMRRESTSLAQDLLAIIDKAGRLLDSEHRLQAVRTLAR